MIFEINHDLVFKNCTGAADSSNKIKVDALEGKETSKGVFSLWFLQTVVKLSLCRARKKKRIAKNA